jgi:predicted transcriptional regulator
MTKEKLMKPSTARPVAVKLDDDSRARIKKLADARQRTPHWMMREAISQYIEREEQRESFKQDAMAAWEDYQLTGRHVTFEDADAWLGQLEAGRDAELPDCQN